MEAFFVAVAILAWLFDLVKKARKASRARTNMLNPPPSPAQQALAEAQRQEQALGLRPVNPQTLPQRAPPLFGQPPSGAVPPRGVLARQPSAGGPAVLRETSTADFARQERSIQTEEPSGLGVPLTADAPAPSPRQAAPLFGNVDDLVRAVILQEVLGPPLSRRHTPPAPPPA